MLVLFGDIDVTHLLRRALLAACVLSGMVVSAAAQPFSRPSTDGQTTITGQIDVPAGSTGKLPAVVLIAGSGLFDRHVLIGTSGTPRDFLFDDLSAALTAKGLTVVRFDYRGVTCNTRDPRIASERDIAKQQHLIATLCVDEKVRSAVTPETNLDDLAVVVAQARSDPRIDPARLALLGVSEGAIYIGKLLARDPSLARAVTLIGAPLESPMDVMAWQNTERIDFSLRAMMSEPSRLSANDIRAKHADSRLQPFPLALLLPKGEAWSLAELDQLKTVREQAFAQARELSLSKADNEPYPDVGVTIGSHRWRNMFHRDATAVITHYQAFKGPIRLYYGEKDSQVEIARQRAAVSKSTLAAAPTISWRTYPKRGHLLGAHALLAPMDEAVRDELAARLAADLK